jgi:hypothetical protein
MLNARSFIAGHYPRVEDRDSTRPIAWTEMKKSIYSLAPIRELLLAANRRYLEFISTMAVLQLSKSAGIGSARLACFNCLGQPKQLSDEPDLSPHIIAPHPPNLPFPDHVHRLIALNRSPGRAKILGSLAWR